MKALLAALRRQRETLKGLLIEAGVPVDRAEDLLIDAMREVPDEAWARMPNADMELLRRVDSACAQFAANRGRRYRGLRVLGLLAPTALGPRVARRLGRRWA